LYGDQSFDVLVFPMLWSVTMGRNSTIKHFRSDVLGHLIIFWVLKPLVFQIDSYYNHDLLHKANKEAAKLVASPMSSTTKLSEFDGDAFFDPTLYMSIIGSYKLFYSTRSVICSQHMHRLTVHH